MVEEDSLANSSKLNSLLRWISRVLADTKFGDRERRKSLARVEEWSFIVNQPTADADDLVSWLQGDAKPVETQYLEQVVVLDMASPYVYIGRFVASDERYFVLEEADVHDLRDSTTTRELYVLDSRKHGISVNRKRVCVNRDQVVSISALQDVQT